MAIETVFIKDLITYTKRDYAIPEMQREFVWSNTQVRDFMDSLYKKHPVGMLLVWEVTQGDDVPIRHIDDSNRDLKDFRFLVIDGQQRITSLLLIKQGELFKNDKKRALKLLFNVDTEEFQIENPKTKNSPEWINVTELLKAESAISVLQKEVLKHKIIPQEEVYDKYLPRLEKIRNIFMGESYSIPIFKIMGDITYEEVTDIFVKLNDKGTKIRITELILALLSLKLPGQFKENLNQFTDELEEKGWFIETSVIIRCLVAIAVKGARLKYFRNIVNEIKEKELDTIWLKTRDSISHALQILEHNVGIKNSRVLPSQLVLVPLSYYLSKKERLSERDSREFILWFLLASYWSRYSGPVETRLEEDIKYIEKNIELTGLQKLLKERVGRLFISNEDFVGTKENQKLLSYATLRAKGAEDWWRGHKITTSDYEEHHVFPRSLLFEAGYSYQEIDDVANLAFLTQKANRTILNKEPYEYLSGVDKSKLKKQCVIYDKELLKIKNYKRFINKRRSLLVKEINLYLKYLGLK